MKNLFEELKDRIKDNMLKGLIIEDKTFGNKCSDTSDCPDGEMCKNGFCTAATIDPKDPRSLEENPAHRRRGRDLKQKKDLQKLAGIRPMYEQLSDWEECQRVVDTDGFSSYEQASQQCCAKCSTVVEGDQCFDFCQERCCEIEEPCEEPAGGCGPGLVFNPSTCHCDPEGIDEDPCGIFNAQTNTYWKESICNACENGTANEYQSNYCECCTLRCYGCMNGSPVGISVPYGKGCPKEYTTNYALLVANTNNCQGPTSQGPSDPGKLTGRRVINRK